MEKEAPKNWIRGGCIGRGAYGTVNTAVNLQNGDVFAVKSVDLSNSHPSQIQALENEIRILKSISSPFVVKYLGDDTTPSHRNLHMEYMPRGNVVSSSSPSSEESVREYTWCLVSALSYLHSRGIVHCDVKGKNVLLGSSPGSAKLADFGSAVEFGSGSCNSTRGSPLWMAPEVVRGEYQGPESDVWSLGCTVIEMMTGKPGWEFESGSVLRIGFSDELPVYPVRLSVLGRDFLDKCLIRDIRKRWSCDQLLRHPFISVCASKDLICYSSPRCVLDGYDLEFDDEKVDVEEGCWGGVLGAKERIRGLVSTVGVNWDFSDGWVEVRGGGGVEVEEEGTNLAYFELIGVDEEIEVPNVVELGDNVAINVSWDEENYDSMFDDVVTKQRTQCNVDSIEGMKIIYKFGVHFFLYFLLLHSICLKYIIFKFSKIDP